MLAFPQLASGVTAQYPIKKYCAQRTIVNTLTDGHMVKLADPGAALSQWRLTYQNLADAEIDILQQFFATCEGQLNAFTFLDPFSNLLAWTEALDQGAWEESTFLQMTGGIADPTGGSAATRLTNPTGADLTLQQTINAPGWLSYCLSLYVRGPHHHGRIAERWNPHTRRTVGGCFWISARTPACSFHLQAQPFGEWRVS